MKCSICEKHLNDYLEGELSSDLSNEIIFHLEHCVECRLLYDALLTTEQLILEEKELDPSPYLTTSVMNMIQSKSTINVDGTKYQRIIQPLYIAASITIAVLGGIRIGNLYNTTQQAQKVPVELALMDDLSMESVNMITQE